MPTNLQVWARAKATPKLDPDARTEQHGAPAFARSSQEKAVNSMLKDGRTIYRFKKGQRVRITFNFNDQVPKDTMGTIEELAGESRAGAALYKVNFGSTVYSVVEAALKAA